MICVPCAISASLTKIKGVPNVLRIESQRAKNFDQSGELFVSISIDFNIHFNKFQYISKVDSPSFSMCFQIDPGS